MKEDSRYNAMGQYNMGKLLPRHYKILEMCMAGHSYPVIAKALGMRTGAVSLIVNSPLFQAELVRARQESQEPELLALDRQAVMGKARSILEGATIAAAETVEDLLAADDPAIQLRAAESILDRAFGKGSKGESLQSQVINISVEHINLLNLALKESSNEVCKLTADEAPAQGALNEQGAVHQPSETGAEPGDCGSLQEQGAVVS